MELKYLIGHDQILKFINQINSMVIIIVCDQSVSLLMEIHQLLVIEITLSVYGMSKTSIVQIIDLKKFRFKIQDILFLTPLCNTSNILVYPDFNFVQI
ncbi:unnamed protein product [Paramecium primaurelia]|uniref:Uncharacterized protein n=1 Tax=Paramecium primaurelia TaxID=5886 RepID=A0A8S1L9I4_PARPR|nr:unnamed protein product [Paramecium primaurelia]